MRGSRRQDVRRIILTASGGPFRTADAQTIKSATIEQALNHPNWSMGRKITVDSATLMNKGLEVIEAHHLFGLPAAQIDVLIHPQSIVHSLVEFCDCSVIAQLGTHDMRIPIAYCLAWPERLAGPAPRLDLARIATLTFEEPDEERFPALRLARNALNAGGGAPTVLNAANEVAVAAFLGHGLPFGGIPALVEAALEAAVSRNWTKEPQCIEEALFIDHDTRSVAHALLPEIAAKAL
jgi:1-deoxy-D-xylulose-5-phosphate reductoisomerase